MAKDIIGNTIKEGDTVFFNGFPCEVVKINEANLLGANQISPTRMQGMVVPGSIKLEFEITYDPAKPINTYVLKTPSNQDQALNNKPN